MLQIAQGLATAQAQQDAIVAICSGQAGGPMAALSGLIGTFLGVEKAAIRIDHHGSSWSATTSRALDMALDAAFGLAGGPEPLYLENTGHPSSSRLALARAKGSHLHALGLDWDDTSSRNNG